MIGPIEASAAAWGDALPDWVMVLARECAKTSQSRVAKQLGYSTTLVSLVLRSKYTGDLKAVEEAVRSTFEDLTVSCPVQGDIPALTCRDWRKKARTYSTENSERVRMFRACARCPRNQRNSDET